MDTDKKRTKYIYEKFWNRYFNSFKEFEKIINGDKFGENLKDYNSKKVFFEMSWSLIHYLIIFENLTMSKEQRISFNSLQFIKIITLSNILGKVLKESHLDNKFLKYKVKNGPGKNDGGCFVFFTYLKNRGPLLYTIDFLHNKDLVENRDKKFCTIIQYFFIGYRNGLIHECFKQNSRPFDENINGYSFSVRKSKKTNEKIRIDLKNDFFEKFKELFIKTFVDIWFPNLDLK